MKTNMLFFGLLSLIFVVSCNTKSGSTVVSGSSLVASIENQEFCTKSTFNKDVLIQFGAFSGTSANLDFYVAGADVGSMAGSLSSQTFTISSGSVTLYGMTVNIAGGAIEFASSASTGSGNMVLDVGGDTIEMSLELTKGACNLDVLPYASALPANVITAHYIELNNLQSISKFRSGAGHDFVDDFETCRSMKHYYNFLDGMDFIDRENVPVYAPMNGVISAVSIEGMGTTVHITSADHAYLWAEIFHVELDGSLEVGSTVTAGQLIGSHYAYDVSGGNSDIAVWIRRPDGYRLISQFEVMDPSLLPDFAARGVTDWSTDLYFENDPVANPHLGAGGLVCTGEDFTGGTDPARDYFDLI